MLQVKLKGQKCKGGINYFRLRGNHTYVLNINKHVQNLAVKQTEDALDKYQRFVYNKLQNFIYLQKSKTF